MKYYFILDKITFYVITVDILETSSLQINLSVKEIKFFLIVLDQFYTWGYIATSSKKVGEYYLK